MEEQRLVKKLADYEAEINELEELILKDLKSEKVPLYKKDLKVLKAKRTKVRRDLTNLNIKETANEE